MQIQTIIKKFEDSRKEIEDMLQKFLSEIPGNEIKFNTPRYFNDIEVSGDRSTFSRIFLENGTVFVENKNTDKENEPSYSDELDLFSMNEIHRILIAVKAKEENK